MVAIVGPSGSGKSTVLALAAALDIPSAGEVRALGCSLARLDENELADYPRAPGRDRLPGRQPLAGPLGARERRHRAATRRARRRRATRPPKRSRRSGLASAGTNARPRSPAASSSGWRSPPPPRGGPALVLADEPTGELDERNEAIVLEALRELRDVYAARSCVVTHADRVAGACDRVVAIATGGWRSERRRRRPHGARRLRLPVERRLRQRRGAGRGARASRPRDRAPASTWRSWGAPGRGRRRCCTSSAASWSRPPGTVSWKGEPLSSLDAAARGRARARGIAYVFQGANLLPNLTAWENVAFAARPRRRRHRRRAARTAARTPDELLALVGLRSKARLPAGGALRRRAAAGRDRPGACAAPGAAALRRAHRPSRLDTGDRVLDLIEALRDELGFALVIATHDADVAARADRAVELADGRPAGDEP